MRYYPTFLKMRLENKYKKRTLPATLPLREKIFTLSIIFAQMVAKLKTGLAQAILLYEELHHSVTLHLAN